MDENNIAEFHRITEPTVTYTDLGRSCLWRVKTEEQNDGGNLYRIITLDMPDALTTIEIDPLTAARYVRGEEVESLELGYGDNDATVVRWIAAGFHLQMLKIEQKRAKERMVTDKATADANVSVNI